MSDFESRDVAMDALLRRSLAAPAPRLSPDFEKGLKRELRRRSEPPRLFGVHLLLLYGVVSAVTCLLVMRSQGLGWAPIAVLITGPLVMLAVGLGGQRSILGENGKDEQ